MKTLIHYTAFLVLGFFSQLGLAAEPVGVSVQNAWIKLAPPGAAVNSAYMRLHNHSSVTRVVVAVSADCCAQVMMHESRRVGDKVFMDHLDSIEIPAQSERLLAPGGVHLMLIGARTPLAVNDQVKIVLDFSDGLQHIETVPVKRAADD